MFIDNARDFSLLNIFAASHKNAGVIFGNSLNLETARLNLWQGQLLLFLRLFDILELIWVHQSSLPSNYWGISNFYVYFRLIWLLNRYLRLFLGGRVKLKQELFSFERFFVFRFETFLRAYLAKIGLRLLFLLSKNHRLGSPAGSVSFSQSRLLSLFLLY